MKADHSRPAALAMDAERFKALGHELVDRLAELLASVPQRPVTSDRSPDEVREALNLTASLPEKGTDAAVLLDDSVHQLFDRSLFNAHPRFFGYITAPPAPIGILGDLIASALNANLGSWSLSPAATEIEVQTVRWIAELIGFPASCGGLLVSGGNMANLVCLLAARTALAPWDVRAEGVGDRRRPRLVAYASSETHTWIQKAADICGIGTDAIRWIPAGATMQMDVSALARAIDTDVAAGHVPFLAVGTAGTVGTGAVDPLVDIAAVCREKRIWFHVDGAYGGIAAALPDAPADLYGLRQADSVAVDPHKWLYAPLEAGCVLVRDREALRRTFSYHPPYYHFDDQYVNFVDLGPQNSRGFRALKVWLALRQAGADGYRRMIADDIALARRLAADVESHRELELTSQSLSITTFRYVPVDLRPRLGDADVETYLNDLNRRLLDRLQRSGAVFVSNAVIGERYVLRACIVNFHTTAADVDAVPAIVAGEGRLLDSRMRPEPAPAGDMR
jgi:aromatic-L-amino-acid decarboxylase